jgi:hypothetical protein
VRESRNGGIALNYHGGGCCVIRPRATTGKGKGKGRVRMKEEGREGRELLVLSRKGLVTSGGLEDGDYIDMCNLDVSYLQTSCMLTHANYLRSQLGHKYIHNFVY